MENLKILENIIASRRSIFPAQFDTDKSIPKTFVDQLLEAANWAPTHGRTEPWRFTVVGGEAKKGLGEVLAKVYEKTPKFKSVKRDKLLHLPSQSNYVIAIKGVYGKSKKIPAWEETAAIAMAVQNIYLMVSAAGYGGYWSSPEIIKDSEVHQFLSMEEGEELLGFFYLGVPSGSIPDGLRKTSGLEKTTWLDK